MNEEEKKAIEGLFHLAHINAYIDLEKNDVINISRPLIEQWKDETKILLNLIDKQQKEINNQIGEIHSLYNQLDIKDNKIEELKHFKEEVIDIIKYADDTAEPTYWNIRKLLGLGE